MKRILFILLLLSVSFSSCAQRNYTAKKLLFSQVQKPYINYGYLYNWWAATDARNIANTGWHLPSRTEYRTLADYLGAGGNYTSNSVGGNIKEKGFIYWLSPNTGATNTANFNARGSGARSSSGNFADIKITSAFWTSTVFSGSGSYVSDLNNSTSTFFVFRNSNNPSGQGVRLLKDATSLSHGQSGVYVGNDGKIYRTICIGTQEWLADNLAETKYRNGDDIPEVTSNVSWAALSTGARCVYNNLESYR